MPKTRVFLAGQEQQLRVRFKGVLLTLILSGVLYSPVQACLNDKEMEPAEKQFRSRYETTPPATVVNHQEIGTYGWVGLGIGAGLCAGSLVVAVGREKRRSR